jgi:hypothetical protein
MIIYSAAPGQKRALQFWRKNNKLYSKIIRRVV